MTSPVAREQTLSTTKFTKITKITKTECCGFVPFVTFVFFVVKGSFSYFSDLIPASENAAMCSATCSNRFGVI